MNAEPQRTSVLAGTFKLIGFAALAAFIVAGAWQVTHERIRDNQAAARLARFAPVLGNVRYDTIDFDHAETLAAPHPLPGDAMAVIYQVRLKGQSTARVFEVSTQGYSGPIRLLVGIDNNHTVTGTRVISHTETPGLGDDIERRKSDWIESFAGVSFDTVAPPAWRLKRDGGHFDGFTGASVTPRAVVTAVRETLEFAIRNPVEKAGITP